MAADFHPGGVAALPTAFPVFPLPGALLLPHGKLPLNIFEPRYLALVEDALAPPRMFGLIMPDPSTQALFQIGCLGRLSAFSETADGRFLITLTGVIRFTVIEELALARGYRRVRADFSGFATDLDIDVPSDVALDREELFAALRRYFGRRGFEANWEAINEMPDPMLVVTLAMACPFAVAEKQALLEAPTAADRAGVLLALLEMDRPGDGDQGRYAS